MITEIRSKHKKKKELLALILDVSDMQEGSFGVTEPSWSLQVLMMKRRAGHVVRKHMHKKIRKSTKQPMEALVVIRGAVQASIFDRKGILAAKKRVSAGQCLLIVDGAHEVAIQKNALMYAFKDGLHVQDKVMV